MARGDTIPAPDLPRELVLNPHIRLNGEINEGSIDQLRNQLDAVSDDVDPVAIELTTTGGDADAGRRLALEVRLVRERLGKRRLVMIGKTYVMSAGATVMAAFRRDDRYLTRETTLLIHCRHLKESVELPGPLSTNAQVLRAALAKAENGMAVEREDFAELVDGSDVTVDEINERASYNWYLTAEEALQRRLIAGLV